MPDISMCSNKTCPLKETCYRSTAIPNPYGQTYASFTWSYDEGQNACDFYWPTK